MQNWYPMIAVVVLGIACAGIFFFRRQKLLKKKRRCYQSLTRSKAKFFVNYYGTEREKNYVLDPIQDGETAMSMLERCGLEGGFLHALARSAVEDGRLPDVVVPGSNEFIVRARAIRMAIACPRGTAM